MCLGGLLGILVWIIVLVAIVAVARILLAYAQVPATVVRIVNVVLWAVIAIACVYIVFDLLSCAMPLPRLR